MTSGCLSHRSCVGRSEEAAEQKQWMPRWERSWRKMLQREEQLPRVTARATYAFSRNASLDMFWASKFVAKLNTSSDHSWERKSQ